MLTPMREDVRFHPYAGAQGRPESAPMEQVDGRHSQRFNAPVEIMRVTLIYDGLLPSASNSSRLKEKWAIREKLHPQLEAVWRDHPAVSKWMASYPVAADEASNPESKGTGLLSVFAIGDERFVPLVTKRLDMSCYLNILFLRSARPGGVVGDGGDIDNRLKTLFDALRMPLRESELLRPALSSSSSSSPMLPRPYFCLLEDDSLISGFQIKTEQLFYPVPQSADAVRLIIEARIYTQVARYGTLSLLGD